MAEQIPTSGEVIFKPNPGPQTEFFAATEQEILFGGAAGGGKSISLVIDPVRYFDNSEFKGLLLRRTMPELRELISISKKYYPKLFPRAKWTERDTTWRFPSGAWLWMSYLERMDDIDKYYGQAYSWIGFDELTHWESPQYWNMLASRLRTSKDSGLPLYMRASTNPGNRGMSWVKKMFIDPAPPNTPFWATDIETGKVLTWPENHSDPEKAGKPLFKRRFIPSKLSDNPYLYEDGKYEANLLSLPEAKRLQLLEGSWDMMEGAAFPEWNREIHVIEPFNIPKTWTRFRAADYGYNDSTVVVWFAVAPNNQLIVYRELKVNKTTAEDLAELILEAEAGERISYGVLDSSVWSNRGESSISIADQMIMRGVKWRKSDRSKGSRVSRKNELHARLKVNEYTEEPGIVFFNTCLACISEIPMIPLDKNNPEDVDTKAEDHAYDAITYGIATRPMVKDFRSGGRLRTGFQAADPVFGG